LLSPERDAALGGSDCAYRGTAIGFDPRDSLLRIGGNCGSFVKFVNRERQ
jgi:hypothetical protein